MLQVIVVGFIGLGASFLSNISGGGGALIQLPALLAIGVAPLTAIGTIKVGSLGLVAGSVVGSKGKGIVRKEFLLPLMIVVALASIIGPRIALSLPESTVKIISSVLVLVSASLSIITWRIASASRQAGKKKRILGYFLYFLTISVLAGIGSGVGIIANYVLIGLLGMSALETVATRRVTGLVGVPLQFLSFALSGHINYTLGGALLVGSILGSFLGMRVAIKQGSEFIKRSMAMASILLVIYVLIDSI